MNVNKLMSSFDGEKFKSECIVHDFLKTYIKIRKQLDDYSGIMERLLKSATCFPSECENCAGIQKCAGCINQDILADAFLKLQKYL
jgi:hypothetical protein